jgi:hypothetical protein
MESTSVRFAAAVRTLGVEARRRGLAVPGFRSPPRLRGVDRSLRRRVDGGAMVAVVLRGRPWPAVLADLVEGVVAANRLSGPAADQARAALWAAVGGDTAAAA